MGSSTPALQKRHKRWLRGNSFVYSPKLLACEAVVREKKPRETESMLRDRDIEVVSKSDRLGNPSPFFVPFQAPPEEFRLDGALYVVL